MKTILDEKATEKSMQKGPGDHCYNTKFNLSKDLIVSSERRQNNVVRHTYTPYLSKVLISRILVNLPAKVLQDVMRYVCKEWFHIIKDPAFVTANLQYQIPSSGILVQNRENPCVALYAEINKAGLTVTELRLPFAAHVCGSCNGLVLLYDKTDPEVLHVVNLVTKVRVSLPRIGRLIHHEYSDTLACTSYGRCKVVCVVRRSSSMATSIPEVRVLVFTLGNDSKWRQIDNERMFSRDEVRVLTIGARTSIAGFVYWIDVLLAEDFCFALDVDTETLYVVPLPKVCPEYGSSYRGFVNMENTVGLVIYTCRRTMQIWKLTDIKLKASGWCMAFDIDMAPLCSRLDPKFCISNKWYSRPLLCLRNGELWLRLYKYNGVKQTYALVFYNSRNGDMFSWTFDDRFTPHYPHVNSLVLLDNNHKLQLQ